MNFVPKQMRNNLYGVQTFHDVLISEFLSIRSLNLDKTVFALLNLIAISEVYCFQLRFSSIFMLQYFTVLVG